MATQLNEPPLKNRYLDADSVTRRVHAEGSALIPHGTSRLHYVFEPYPIYARSASGCRLTDVDGDQRIDCLNNMTALIHGHCDADVNAAIVAFETASEFHPENVEALKRLGPELVTPAVIFLCSEDAPNGVILQAAGGRYSVACVVENEGIDLGVDATVEDIADNYDAIVDLSNAKPRNMLQLAQQ